MLLARRILRQAFIYAAAAEAITDLTDIVQQTVVCTNNVNVKTILCFPVFLCHSGSETKLPNTCTVDSANC